MASAEADRLETQLKFESLQIKQEERWTQSDHSEESKNSSKLHKRHQKPSKS